MTVTRIVLVWHMHQPPYRDPLNGTFVLPWVRLHALKDYWGMVKILDETPGVHVSFNFTPCLLDQVEAYARGEAIEIHRELSLKPAAELGEQERIFALKAFFPVSQQLFQGLPRLGELKDKGGAGRDPQSLRRAAARFTAQDLLDLQVLSTLAWFDRDWRKVDPALSGLVAKERNFSEEDKGLLAEREHWLLGQVIPAYRRAREEGRIELTTSPYYHPILPLLCDSAAHHEAQPGAPLPPRYKHPEDAADQIRLATGRHREIFGTRPSGMWPSEGSVSEEAVVEMAKAGFDWTASDEAVLERSIGHRFHRDGVGIVGSPHLLYRPWVRRTPAGEVKILFRDRQLSDLIGFAYPRQDPHEAAADLLARVKRIGEEWGRLGLRGDPVVSIILDGENAWEYYADGGRDFLRAVYQGIEADPALTAVTATEALATAEAEVLPRVFAGSWIHGDFSVWIGHADDRRAWELLGEARETLVRAEGNVDPVALERAWDAFRAACGSDWFWWYGDDRTSEDDLEFDRLFRRQLEAIARALGVAPPEALTRTLITTRRLEVVERQSTGPVDARIDGRISSAGEWATAGVYQPPLAGAMARGAPTVHQIRFGVGHGFLNVLIEMTRGQFPADAELVLLFPREGGLRYRVVPAADETIRREERRGQGWTVAATASQAAVGQVVEIGIPLLELRAKRGREEKDGKDIEFRVVIERGRTEIERHPEGSAIGVTVEEGPHER